MLLSIIKNVKIRWKNNVGARDGKLKFLYVGKILREIDLLCS